MSLFCGKTCKCTQKSKGYFPGQPDLQKGFRNACVGNNALSKEEYLCSGKYVDEQTIMLAYGYDPCSGGKSIGDVLDPTRSAETEQENLEQLTPVFIILGIGVIVGIIAFVIIAKRK
ncbi:hypothetical protein Halhy_5906 [Haliscomenobacter hydrossis DSM 1100]|uniref:Uncharacterized protein n=1 Tax=Haliscomenobacter hydrossis (strain ATCC 27775 / DSM 1100 / LMG 10767 / O) TaxID=760192 RepID=F4KZ75_HALH1|nr:hypothetical protein Halhy_5906 [Haliscomenobacter hydrossis DSM 1100]